MHERLFAQAQNQPSMVVLGLRLKPYSIGHDLILIQHNNQFAEKQVKPVSTLEVRRDLIGAVLVCCRGWMENKKPHRWFKLWRWLNRNADYPKEIERFNLYRAIGISQPIVTSPKELEGERPMGSPFHAALIQFLVSNLGKTEIEALDYPIGLAKMHFYAWCEARGTVNVLNERESQFEEECARRDAVAAEKEKAGQCLR